MSIGDHEIFMANLNEIIQYYDNDVPAVDTVCTDAEWSFGEAIYPTASLKQLLGDVFHRLGARISARLCPSSKRLSVAVTTSLISFPSKTG